ncbi:hypothetical protein HU230_0008020 [Bradyrhizobium quebecense]|uniref:Uncharacterized protein n=1 Tax=Bradyrhizobium quebecense TaxID=2748629 RepID=A0A973WPN8_9BRAD|nr:hypothetical protein [Bradyrhizobium quebecense]UGA45973.1 hypothetical protein HU230_0008020 [Bradyrhizobium quebecense]
MMQAPSNGNVCLRVDVLDVTRFNILVRNRETGREHSFTYDDILIGSSDEGSFYDLVLPRWLAELEGIIDAR